MGRYKAIFFDFDDTLGNREAYAYDCYRAILEENTSIEDPVEFEAVLQDCMLWDEQGNIDKNHVKNMLAKEYGIMLPYEDFNQYWDSRLWTFCRAFDDAEYTLEQLQKHYKLGLITNGPSDGQRNKLRQSGLERFFDLDSIIVSGDYGYKKPDPRLFQQACRNLQVETYESIYVGDIYARDVLGAYRAGMCPIWICTHGPRACGTDIVIIHRISDLLKVL